MRTRLIQAIGTTAAAAALFLWAPAVQAMPATEAGICTAEEVKRGNAEATEVQREALRFMKDGKAEKAADRLLRAVELRADCDELMFDDLRLAARLYHAAGEVERARATMLRAAEHAVWTGDPGRAAHTYVDAALLAAERGLRAEADDAAGRAEMLARSPLLSTRERVAIVGRIQRGDSVQTATGG